MRHFVPAGLNPFVLTNYPAWTPSIGDPPKPLTRPSAESTLVGMQGVPGGLLVLAFVVGQGLALFAHQRWLANRFSASAMALVSVAAVWLPLLGVGVFSLLTEDRPISLDRWLFLVVLLGIALFMNLGLSRAMYGYMEDHGVRDELGRLRRRRRPPAP